MAFRVGLFLAFSQCVLWGSTGFFFSLSKTLVVTLLLH